MLEQVSQCLSNTEKVLRPPTAHIERTAGGVLMYEGPPVLDRALRHLIVLDISGSMFAEYRGEGSVVSENSTYYWTTDGWRPFIEEAVLGAIQPTDPVQVMLFSRRSILVDSVDRAVPYDEDKGAFVGALPKARFGLKGALPALLAEPDGWLGRRPDEMPFEMPGDMLHGTYLQETLEPAAAYFSSYREDVDGQPPLDGILWIVTDNRTDRFADLKDESNRELYTYIKETPQWQVAYAYPVHVGDWLGGRALMVYGLYYSNYLQLTEGDFHALTQSDSARLASKRSIDRFKQYSSPNSPAPGLPFKLKPDHFDAAEVEFIGNVKCPRVAPDTPAVCEARVRVTNKLNHRQIDSANLILTNQRLDAWGQNSSVENPQRVLTTAPLCGDAITTTQALPQPIPPGQSLDMILDVEMPPIKVVNHTVRDLFESASHQEFIMAGNMDAQIKDLQTSMMFPPQDLGDIYGIASMPDVFKNPNTTQLTTSICFEAEVYNPSWLISVVFLVLLGLLLAVAVPAAWLLRRDTRTVVINGSRQARPLMLSRIFWTPIRQARGRTLASAKLTLGGDIVVRAEKPLRERKRGNKWILGGRDEEEILLEFEHRRSKRSR